MCTEQRTVIHMCNQRYAHLNAMLSVNDARWRIEAMIPIVTRFGPIPDLEDSVCRCRDRCSKVVQGPLKSKSSMRGHFLFSPESALGMLFLCTKHATISPWSFTHILIFTARINLRQYFVFTLSLLVRCLFHTVQHRQLSLRSLRSPDDKLRSSYNLLFCFLDSAAYTYDPHNNWDIGGLR
jgi:hypothetical protein